MTTFMQLVFSEFDGSNYQELATKYRTPVRKIYRVIRLASQAAIRAALQANAGTHSEVLWCDQTERLDNLRSCAALLQAAQTALNSRRPDLSGIALVALPLIPPAKLPGSNLGATSIAPAETQQGTQAQKPLYSSLAPFTQFLGRLVELVGAENAAQLTRDFAGQTLQFPITDHYGDTIERRVTNRLSIHYRGVAYDVSHLPNAAVGELIAVNLADLTPIKPDDFGFPIDAPIIGERYKPLTEAEGKAIADKLVQAPAYQPTAEDIAHRNAVRQVAEACNVSRSAAIRILQAERQRPIAPLSSAGTAPAQDQSGLEGHAGIGVQSKADPNQ